MENKLLVVPPPELCGRIPEDRFSNSLLIYYRIVFQRDDTPASAWILALREQLASLLDSDASQNRRWLTADLEILPAPTLQEILQCLVDSNRHNVVCEHCRRTESWHVHYEEISPHALWPVEVGSSNEHNPLIAALKLCLQA